MYLIYVCLICAVIYTYYKRIKVYKDLNSLPGPPLLPILGNLFDLGSNTVDVLRNINLMKERYGEIFKLWIGPFNPVVVISGAEDIENILTSTTHVHKSSTYEILYSLMGQGLLSNIGDEKWVRHRKLLTPAFHFKILERFIQTFHYLGNTLIEKLNENVDSHNFDIYPYINRYTLDVICETSMGVKLNVQNYPDHEYLKTLGEYKEMFIMRQFSLIGRKESLYKYTPHFKCWNKCVNKLKTFTSNVIERQYKKWKITKLMENNEEQKRNNYKEPFLDLLFDALSRDEITMEEIREEVDTFMAAGHDTTSAAITFALFELAKHQDIQEKILKEINEYAGINEDYLFTISNLQNLKYLESVCKEVLRLYTTVPYIERGVHETLKINGKVIPKGTIIMIFYYGLHNSDKYFKDPEKFNPDRFMSENFVNRNPFTYVPFSAGPRNCIGQRFALLEIKSTLVKIIKNYILLPAVPSHELELGTNLTLYSRNGVPLRIKQRC